ncbi:twin-arginine translocase subunit TatC [Candidatus Marinamargulisbacteria bacterium SCGC AAA071-K20]|nr:twin-arginine translocase subunit TatC [Candidatus Marinamargulisbacteria bacterium SCGC AAA071-K20]
MVKTRKKITLIDHIRELRKRLVISMICLCITSVIGFYLFDPIINFLAKPYLEIPSSLNQKLIITSLFEGFSTKFKLSLVLGAVLALPCFLYQLLRFVLPGLKTKEKTIISISLVSGTILAGLSLYLSYFKLLPFSIAFLTSAQFIPSQIGLLLNYQKSIFFVFNMMIYSMILFQFPIILELLLYLNVIRRKSLLKASRYIFVGIFVFTALITPPDVITQIGLALPLISLYFLTILIAKIFKFGEGHV